jgi:hypothetical protein
MASTWDLFMLKATLSTEPPQFSVPLQRTDKLLPGIYFAFRTFPWEGTGAFAVITGASILTGYILARVLLAPKQDNAPQNYGS